MHYHKLQKKMVFHRKCVEQPKSIVKLTRPKKFVVYEAYMIEQAREQK